MNSSLVMIHWLNHTIWPIFVPQLDNNKSIRWKMIIKTIDLYNKLKNDQVVWWNVVLLFCLFHEINFFKALGKLAWDEEHLI